MGPFPYSQLSLLCLKDWSQHSKVTWASQTLAALVPGRHIFGLLSSMQRQNTQQKYFGERRLNYSCSQCPVFSPFQREGKVAEATSVVAGVFGGILCVLRRVGSREAG